MINENAANGGGNEYKANLLTSKNPVYDLFGAISYANSSGQLQNIADVVMDNNYANIQIPEPRYKKVLEMNGHKIEVRVTGQSSTSKGYYDIYQMGFGHLDRFTDYAKTTNYNMGYYQGFFMTGYERNYLITIGVRTNAAFNYLKNLYYGF